REGPDRDRIQKNLNYELDKLRGRVESALKTAYPELQPTAHSLAMARPNVTPALIDELRMLLSTLDQPAEERTKAEKDFLKKHAMLPLADFAGIVFAAAADAVVPPTRVQVLYLNELLKKFKPQGMPRFAETLLLERLADWIRDRAIDDMIWRSAAE